MKTAPEAYAGHLEGARAALAAISALLDAHRGDHLHWGHVGDLAHVNELLDQVNRFLSPEDEE